MSTHPRIPDDITADRRAPSGVLSPIGRRSRSRRIAASDEVHRAYEDALETAAGLALAVVDLEPPADLRDHIVAAARRRAFCRARRTASPPRRGQADARRPADAVGRLRRPRSRSGDHLRADHGLAARLSLGRSGPQDALVSILSARDARIVHWHRPPAVRPVAA